MTDGSYGYSDSCYQEGITEKGVVECPNGGFAADMALCGGGEFSPEDYGPAI